MNDVRLLGSSVSFHVQTEHRADNRSSQNQKPKLNRKTDGFGSVLGFRSKCAQAEGVPCRHCTVGQVNVPASSARHQGGRTEKARRPLVGLVPRHTTHAGHPPLPTFFHTAPRPPLLQPDSRPFPGRSATRSTGQARYVTQYEVEYEKKKCRRIDGSSWRHTDVAM